MFPFRVDSRRVCAVVTASLAFAVGRPAHTHAADLPPGFTETLIASGLSEPTAMAFAPDGRLFVCEKAGRLRVIKNGALLATPFVTLTVDAFSERGLLGVTFDPDFATTPYVYVYHTEPASSGTPPRNRVTRFTANGDIANSASAFLVVELDDLVAGNHNGGAIHFGADGKLYVAVGDNANPANAQVLSNRHGKLLRLNGDGTIPVDNPTTFPGISGASTGPNGAIWAVGLRNPFTFAFNPAGPPALMVNDVGQDSFEELNVVAAAANLGWPATEGDFDPAANPAFTRPRYAYARDAGRCAVTGGAFYNPPSPTFPAAYLGTYFFADYCAGWIKRIDPIEVFPYPTLTAAIDFASGIEWPVDLAVGPDGHLYYLAIGSGGVVVRVQYGADGPSITSQPANVTVQPGQSATFTVGASGAGVLSYQWQRNGVDLGGATSASYVLADAQLSDSGARFRANVSNAGGNVYSNEAVLTVTVNQPPAATITLPVEGLLYTGGMMLAFAGSGTDVEDGVLGPAAFSWLIEFHHDTHTHPFMPTTPGIVSGSVVIPTSGETSANVWYRVYLTVTDSGGLSTTVQRDVFPQVVRITLATSPAGLQITLDEQPTTAPIVVMSVVGVQRSIEAREQALSGISYGFSAWADGGDGARVVATPPVDTTYTATFRPLGAAAPPSPPAIPKPRRERKSRAPRPESSAMRPGPSR